MPKIKKQILPIKKRGRGFVGKKLVTPVQTFKEFLQETWFNTYDGNVFVTMKCNFVGYI